METIINFIKRQTDQMLSRISYPCIGIVEGQYSYHCVVICAWVIARVCTILQ